VLVQAGAVLLPCDDQGLAGIAERNDVCTCTDTESCDKLYGGSNSSGVIWHPAPQCTGQKRWRGEILAEVLEHRQAQHLILARQRLRFASIAHPRLGATAAAAAAAGVGGVVDAEAEGDWVIGYDVLNTIGLLLLSTPELRPGWLGREAGLDVRSSRTTR